MFKIMLRSMKVFINSPILIVLTVIINGQKYQFIAQRVEVDNL